MINCDVYLFQGCSSQSIYDYLREVPGLRVHKINKNTELKLQPHHCLIYECEDVDAHKEQIQRLASAHLTYLVLCWNQNFCEKQMSDYHILYLPPKKMLSMSVMRSLLIKIKLLCSKNAEEQTKTVSTQLIGIGASTGGPAALSKILHYAPFPHCGMIIVQHMGEQQLPYFAEYLKHQCHCEIKNAMENEIIQDGMIYLAKEKKHLIVKKEEDGFHLHYAGSAKVNCVCPSIDPLFQSLAKEAQRQAIGVLLTGMGKDGVIGLKQMKEAGACTIIQDEATCDLYGMPKEAKKIHAHVLELPIDKIGIYLRQKGGSAQDKGERR